VADAVRTLLAAKPDLNAEFSLWNEFFSWETMVSALDVLEKAFRDFSYAIVLFTQDDLTISKWEEKPSPRDNLVFELGLSISALGRERTALLIESGDIKMPSDLHGVMPDHLNLPPVDLNSRMRDPAKLSQSLALTCSRIARNLQTIQWDQPPKYGYPKTLRRLRDHWECSAVKQPDFKLYTFCGLSEETDPDSVNKKIGMENIYFLWANAERGSWIRAAVINDRNLNRQLIRLSFTNNDEYPGNVAIRLAGQELTATPDGKPFRTLRFEARIPPDYIGLFNNEEPKNMSTEPLAEIGLNIRLVDAFMTHWQYCLRNISGEYLMFAVLAGRDWTECRIDLEKHKWWFPFNSDGNYLYHSVKPDFSQILAIVIEVGARGATRAGPGAGIVELRDFKAEQ
jgi:hypothetical protein